MGSSSATRLICYGFGAAFCLLTLTYSNVRATDASSNRQPSSTGTTNDKTLLYQRHVANRVLMALFERRQQSFVDSIRGRMERGDPLDNTEIVWKNAQKLWNKKGPDDKLKYDTTTDEKLRKSMIEYLPEEAKAQTIAISVNNDAMEVVVAGNIKTTDFSDFELNIDSTKGVSKTQAIKMFAKVKTLSAGFEQPDFEIVREITSKYWPGHKIIIIQALETDTSMAQKSFKTNQNKDASAGDLAKVKAQTHHAEMLLMNYHEQTHSQKTSDSQVTLIANKPYCIKCLDTMMETELVKNNVVSIYSTQEKRNEAPKNWSNVNGYEKVYEYDPEAEQIRSNTQQHRDSTPEDSEVESQALTSSCAPGARRRKRSCGSVKVITSYDADETSNLLSKSTVEEQNNILADVDDIGVDNVEGSEKSKNIVKSRWKKWKAGSVKRLLRALKGGKIMSTIFGDGADSVDLTKTAISPKLLLDSMSQESRNDENTELATAKPREYRKTGVALKAIKNINLALFGKDIIGALARGDSWAVFKMSANFAGGKLLNQLGDFVTNKGKSLLKVGRTGLSRLMRIGGPIIGGGTIALNVISLVNQMNDFSHLRESCKNESLFQKRHEIDCKFDQDLAISSLVSTYFGIVESVSTFAIALSPPLLLVTGLVDLALAIHFQIDNAIQKVAKLSSSIVGGLNGKERFEAGIRYFVGLDPPPNLEKLLDLKEGYNYDVTRAVEVLEQLSGYQTIVIPTTEDRTGRILQVPCKEKDLPQVVIEAITLYYVEKAILCYFSPLICKEECCDGAEQNCPHGITKKVVRTREYEKNSLVNFKYAEEINSFRVQPDEPGWGNMECFPNSRRYSPGYYDPEHYEVFNGSLCQNAIVLTARNRVNRPVLVDLKDGDDEMLGFPHRKHVFLVEKGHKFYAGGEDDDIFVIKTSEFTGQLNGYGGRNSLLLADDTKMPISIDLSRQTQSCPQSSNCGQLFVNIQQFIGRSNNSDSLSTACNTEYVDLRGGKSESYPDEIYIPFSSCKTNCIFKIHPYTTVENIHGAHGTFTYEVELGPSIQVKLDPLLNSHHFFFSNDITYADLSLSGETFSVRDKTEDKYFSCNFTTSPNFTLSTKAGLSIHFDKDTNSYFGFASPTDNANDVRGLLKHPNRFILRANITMNIQGGQKDDIFSLTGNSTAGGLIDGGDGADLMVIHQGYHVGQKVTLDLTSKVLSPGGVKFSNIQRVIGRPGLCDEIKNLTCELLFVDLNGGKNAMENDMIQIPPQFSCKSEIYLMVWNFTRIENLATTGQFHYEIDVGDPVQSSFIQVNMDGTATHKYRFKKHSNTITEMEFNSESEKLRIQFQNESEWIGSIPKERSKLDFSDQVTVELLPVLHGVVIVASNSTLNFNGLVNYPNTFTLLAGSNESQCRGGGKDDVFYVASQHFFGELIGGDGANAIILIDEVWNGQQVTLDGRDGTVFAKLEEEVEHGFQFNGIHRFFGRERQPDAVFSGCDTAIIDTKGGMNDSLPDLIYIPSNLDCYYELNAVVRPNQILINDATSGDFIYEGDFRGGNTSVFLTFSPYADHKVILALDFLELASLKVGLGRVNMTAVDGSEFAVNYFIPVDEEIHTQPSIAFQDGLLLKINQHGEFSRSVYGILRNTNSSDKEELEKNIETSRLIRRYKRSATELGTSVVMQVKEGTAVSIGSGGLIDIITAAPGYDENILVHNNANDTIYRIAGGSMNVQILIDPQLTGHQVLDLMPIVNGDPIIVPTIEKIGRDVIFKIQDVQITVKRLADENYGDLATWRVILRESFMTIEKEPDNDEKYKLIPHAIMLDPETLENVVLHPLNLEADTKILKQNYSDSMSLERVRQGNNLVFTNVFQSNASEAATTVVFYDFYDEKVAELLEEKRVVIEIEPGVVMNITAEIGEELPTFEQRELEVFGELSPLFWGLPLLLGVLMAVVAYIWWSKKHESKFDISGSIDRGKIALEAIQLKSFNRQIQN